MKASLVATILSGNYSLNSNLSSSQQNGASLLGTLNAPQLPAFLTNNPLPNGFPWGQRTPTNTDPHNPPNTGVTRSYDFTVTRGVIAPDGVQKDVILINGAFPGPLIEANWGDQIQVTVHNHISDQTEGIGFHWHGFLQKKTQYYDGVAAVSQCPIAPSSTFQYSFQADTYGTSWYHSHYSAQYADGLLGPIVIHGPKNVPYDIDLGPVFLTDYYHKPYMQILENVLSVNAGPGPDVTKIIPVSDNNLINGKMNYNCTLTSSPCTTNAGLAKFKFTTGKTHRLRLINAGAEGMQKFSIDGHQLQVIANDFVPITPYTTDVVSLGAGQRTDVLVTANVGKPTDSFWMRSNISTVVPAGGNTGCSSSNQPYALAAVLYDRAPTNQVPKSNATNTPDNGFCGNDDLSKTVPLYSLASTSSPDTVKNIEITGTLNASNIFVWEMNGQTFRGDYNAPILLQANKGNLTFEPEWNVYNMGTNKTATFALYNNSPAPHPMHMHGHNFQVLHVGAGQWDGVSVTNPSNPQRRDTQLLPIGWHIAIQITLDNPGAWPLHCHIAWHVSGGLYVTILENPAAVKQINIPQSLAQGCQDWTAYTNKNVVDQIDSGLKFKA